VLHQGWPKAYASDKVHAIFTASYVLMGFVAAIPKGYLYGNGYFQRMLVGIIAGGLSLVLYHALLKRFAGILGVNAMDIADPDDEVGLRAIAPPAVVKP